MGQDKALLKLDGRPLISIVIERLRYVCSDVMIVASDAEQYNQMTTIPVVQDIFPNVGVLGGLHAGLAAAS
ncbi:MAG: NTP transferase domain-containing protein, partial [Anaerolineae bacterium]|nr:NTP transferase domain-containing protein [Anaerolineae bacterium]